MDRKLLAWGVRQRGRCPALWLFTDSVRAPDPLPAIARLPPRRAGVVFRHDFHPNRNDLGARIARICRARRLTLVVAGDTRLAAKLGAGVHLRGGRWPSALHIKGFATSSVHSVPDLRRAARAGVALAFLSPAFSTESHRGAPGLGSVRWSSWARQAPSCLVVAALGGIDGNTVRRLPRHLCAAVGAIGALS
jgi:thiamine-phosphate pyrophosphorylase